MASLGLQAQFYGNPNGANKKTISVTCSPGSNPGLFVVVTMSTARNFNNAFYKNTSGVFIQMQRMTIRTLVSNTTRQVGYWMPNPPTGVALDFEVRFNGAQNNPIQIYAQSFTGVTQSNLTTEHGYNISNSPHSRSITIAANDLICLAGLSTQSMTQPFVIGGVSAALKVSNRSINGKRLSIAYSGTSLSAGSTVCTTVQGASWATVTNVAWVIAAAGSTPSFSVSPSAASGMTYALGSGPSAEATTPFTINGSDLTANVVFTIPSSFEASLTSGSSYSNSLTLPQSPSGTITNLTVYVRAKNGLSQGTTNEQGSVATTGAATQNFQFTVFVTAPPPRRRIIIT